MEIYIKPFHTIVGTVSSSGLIPKYYTPFSSGVFSWEEDITMGLWEGFTSIIGYALMLAVNIPFFPHFEGKKNCC